MHTPDVPLDQLIRSKREEILAVAARHGAVNVRLFGSVARGEAGPDSDVDLLIDVREPVSSWFPSGLILELEELLGRKVHVITENALHPVAKSRVMQELVPL